MVRTRKRPTFDLKTQEFIPSEYEECKAFWHYLQTILKIGKSVFHVPNEGIRDKWYGKALENIGMTTGVADYIFLLPNDKYHGLIIEMKRKNEKNRKKREDQEEFLANCSKSGYYSTFAYGCDDAIKVYKDYISNRL